MLQFTINFLTIVSILSIYSHLMIIIVKEILLADSENNISKSEPDSEFEADSVRYCLLWLIVILLTILLILNTNLLCSITIIASFPVITIF